MNTVLIIIGYILIYIFGMFTTYIMMLYIDRCVYGTYTVYTDIDEVNVVMSFFWPVTIWILAGYLLYMKLGKNLKKLSIAIVETLYQINHKEDKNGNDD